MTVKRLLLLGPPGAGKGTQAARLEKSLHVPQVSTGDMLRAAVDAETEVGKLASSYMERGELVPDSVVIRVAGERLKQDDAKRGFILDGFPRTAPQAEALDELLDAMDRPLQRCLSLAVDENVIVKRLMRRAEIEGRADDNEETIRNRMRVYREQTAPLVDYYEKRNLLVEVDGDGSIEEVAERLEAAVAA